MSIEITCNTDDEVLFRNIEINSRRDLEWITEVPAHDGHAVIVGGGPSVKNHIETIRWRQSLGQKVFALNGAASYLTAEGIIPDFQVFLDARDENIDFLDGSDAKVFLVASQCSPALLDVLAQSSVQLWHPKFDGIEDHLPDKRESLTLIGGGISVGLSAMCLAYAMGYRKLHLYGYDSSHKEGAKHAYAQPMNDSENVVKVTVFGKTFKTSLTMAKQAEAFQRVADQLIDLGCIVTVDGDGLLPYMIRESDRRASLNPQTEQEKYEAMWTLPEYRTVAPGELVAEKFVEVSGVKAGDIVMDFGCGTGRGAKKIHDLAGCEFILTDFTSNSLDEEVKGGNWYTFYRHDLTEPFDIRSEFGFCTDVMEHIPPDDVGKVIQNIMRASGRVFFQISLVDDACGALIGKPLHLSVHPFEWWKEKFLAMGYHIEWSQDCGESALFYVAN